MAIAYKAHIAAPLWAARYSSQPAERLQRARAIED